MRTVVDGEIRVGKIDSVDFIKDKVLVILEKEKIEFELEHVSRIL